MSARRTPGEIRAADQRMKGASFEKDSVALAAFAEDRARDIVRAHLVQVERGDPENPSPIVVGVVPRLAEILSVLYRSPATRVLKRGDDILADSDPAARLFSDLSRKAMLDSLMALAEWRRSVAKQAFIGLVESHASKSVVGRVYWPFEVARYVTPAAADDLEQDEAILVCLEQERADRPGSGLYQLFQHEEDGTWTCHIVNGSGAPVGSQPYGDEGRLAFGLPLIQTYDALPCGQAWLSIPQGRLDATLSVCAAVNDLAYIVGVQAHALITLETQDPEAVKEEPPATMGPADLAVLPRGSTVAVHQPQPQVAALINVVDSQLSYLCVAESLPPDSFAKARTPQTGPAWKAANADLESRRMRQVPLGLEYERRLFGKLRALHNTYAGAWKVARLDEDLELAVSFARTAVPSDARETQELAFKDLAVGAGSIVSYLMERNGLDRAAALDLYAQVTEDRAAYPVAQNPGAIAGDTGPRAALGEDSATFNPDVASSVEGASVTAAVVDRLDAEASSPAPAVDETAPAAGTAGSSGKSTATALEVGKSNSVVAVIKDVAKREIDRASGIELLQVLYGLTSAEAERVMGRTGREFFVDDDEPVAAGGPVPPPAP